MQWRLLAVTTVLLCTAYLTDCRDIQYQVIVPPSDRITSVAVVINDQSYALQQSSVDPIVYTGTAPEGQYYYAKTTESRVTEREPFARMPAHDDATPYEFYNRSVNQWNITPLPQMFEPSSNRAQNDLHIEGQIGTIHIMGNQSEIDFMHKNIGADFEVNVDFTFIRGNDMSAIRSAKFKLSGRVSRYNPKLSYNVKISKGEDLLYGNRRFKLRSLALDPSYIREAIASKIYESVGVTTTRFSYVRLFINNQSIGLFGLVEHVKNPWIRNEFAGGSKDYLQGILYQAVLVSPSTQDVTHMSDLHYEGSNLTVYELGQYKIKEEASDKGSSFQPLSDLTKFIADAPIDDVAQWNRRFDMDSVIRSLVLEIIVANSDGYISVSNNYFIYQDGLNSERFVFIPYDFDLIFGTVYEIFKDKAPENSTYPDVHMRPLLTQLLRVPQFKNQFDTLLYDISRRLVNPSILDKLIDEIAAMIRQDVEWDQTLPGSGSATFLDFINHIISDSKTIADNQHTFAEAMDMEPIEEAVSRKPIPFDTAVSGHTGYKFLPGLKEFIANNSRAILSSSKTA